MTSLPHDFRCYYVTRDDSGHITGQIARRPLSELPEGDVLIRVDWSSLNYKDALAATGHPGVNKVFPHIPGVDAAGTVAHSGVFEFVAGQPVLTTGFNLGSNRWGGWAEYIRVPQEWVVPLPDGLSLRESMMLGTGGLTAAMCVEAIRHQGVGPEAGEIVVTGATGGVASVAIAILAKLGYQVVAVSGKADANEYLLKLGAREVLGRAALDDRSGRPLLSGRWAGAVDTVGGNVLGTVLRSTRHGGCVAACGMAGGNDLPITVYPFILRGVVLSGIDAAWCKLELRHAMWQNLAGPWKPDCLETIARFGGLEQLPGEVERMLAGRTVGRYVVAVSERAGGEKT